MSHRLVFDLGTTYFKAVVFDPEGRSVGIARRATPITHPQPQQAEISTDAFHRCILGLVQDLRQTCGEVFGHILQVSYASQANSFLLKDRYDRALTPVIVWTDRRAQDLRLVPINDYAQTGVPEMDDQFAPAKLAWLAKHRATDWRQARRFCFLSDFLTLWMTGEHFTEAGVAGLSGMIDIHRLTWRAEAIAKLDLGRLMLPKIVRAGTPIAKLRPGIAQMCGLPDTCVFVMGCLDQYAGALAADLLQRGGACETTGTVLATVRVDDFDQHLQAQGVFQGPTPLPGRYYHMLFGDTSANLLAAYRQQQHPGENYEALDGMAAEVYAGNEHPVGREVHHIYQQVAEALRDQLARLCPDGPPARLVSLGGGSRSTTWLQMKADALGCTPQPLPTEEPTAYGVYRLLQDSPQSTPS